jgi:NitT/TauT family transport system permease protein
MKNPAAAPSARRPSLWPKWREWRWFLLSWAILAAIWEISVAVGLLTPTVLPPPSQTIPYLISGPASVGIGYDKVTFFGAIRDTLARVTLGYIAGLATALIFAMAIVRLKLARLIAFPMVQTIAPISPVAWIPLGIVLAGLGGGTAVFVVFMGILGSVTVAAVAAFDAVPQDLLRVARSLGASGWRLWARVVFPAAAPALMTVARLNFFAAWMAVLAGEMAGAKSGLGALILLGQQQYNMKLVMVGIMTIGIIGFMIDRLLLAVQKRLLWWENR